MRSAVIVDVVRIAAGRGKPGGALSGTHPGLLPRRGNGQMQGYAAGPGSGPSGC
jgi:hypothetical protein